MVLPVLKSVALRPSADGVKPNLLRFVWSNIVKADGTRKARACCDGSKRSAPWLRQFEQTYSSCIETPCMRLFFALSAAIGYTITVADVSNAYQQSPGPKVPCFLQIDEAYQDWYRAKFGKSIDPRTHVIPMINAFQGHPAAGRLWSEMIDGILIKELGFKNTTHERNLYRGTIDGKDCLVCRQVDDLAVSSADPATSEKLIAAIGERVTIESGGLGTLIPRKGYHSRYNGIDLYQTRDYVKISCDTYIDRLLQTYGWSSVADDSGYKDSAPISDDMVKKLSLLVGPEEGTAEHKQQVKDAGFAYRQLLGALMYAYVVCRADIGYAICFLARFAAKPHAQHYEALANVAKYLGRTKDWGIVYWRQQPVTSLPAVPLESPTVDDSLPSYPKHRALELFGCVDAAHATDLLNRKSVTGLVFSLAGGAIAYKSKLQACVATSSTEAELYAAVSAAKIAKYLRTVLQELGFPQDGPTKIYEDNQAVLNMVNNSKPTPRARHVDVQYFAIQEWRERGDIELKYIPTEINNSDAGTKALGWVLHSRHVQRSMGHVRPAYVA